nr:MAG TPA: hypothetical protein [Bacteriophage sp.]
MFRITDHRLTELTFHMLPTNRSNFVRLSHYRFVLSIVSASNGNSSSVLIISRYTLTNLQ